MRFKQLSLFNRKAGAKTNPSLKIAQELYRRLLARDTGGYGGTEFMVGDIQRKLKEAKRGLASLDPSGKKSKEAIKQSMDAIVALAHLRDAQELFQRMMAGDIRGYGGANYMSQDIGRKMSKAAIHMECAMEVTVKKLGSSNKRRPSVN